MIKKSEWLTVGKSVENFHYYFASGNPHNLETTSNESVLVFADKNKIYDADDFIEKHNLYMIKDALEYRRRELKIEAIEAEYPIEDIHLLSAIGDAIFCANIEIISEYTDKNSPIEKIFLNGLILIQYMRRLCPSIIVPPISDLKIFLDAFYENDTVLRYFLEKKYLQTNRPLIADGFWSTFISNVTIREIMGKHLYFLLLQPTLADHIKKDRSIRLDVFAANFYTKELNFILEFDGAGTHLNNENFSKDRTRDRELSRDLNIRIERYSGKDINENFETLVYKLNKHMVDSKQEILSEEFETYKLSIKGKDTK